MPDAPNSLYYGDNLAILREMTEESVDVSQVRDLAHVVAREPAAVIGVFITLAPPTSEMRREATTLGSYESAWTGRRYPALQILTIEDLLTGREILMPPTGQSPSAVAPRVTRRDATQGEFEV